MYTYTYVQSGVIGYTTKKLVYLPSAGGGILPVTIFHKLRVT